MPGLPMMLAVPLRHSTAPAPPAAFRNPSVHAKPAMRSWEIGCLEHIPDPRNPFQGNRTWPNAVGVETTRPLKVAWLPADRKKASRHAGRAEDVEVHGGRS